MKLSQLQEAKTSSFGPDTEIPITLTYTVGQIAGIVSSIERVPVDAVLKMFTDRPEILHLLVDDLVKGFHEQVDIADEADFGGVGMGDLLTSKNADLFYEVMKQYE